MVEKSFQVLFEELLNLTLLKINKTYESVFNIQAPTTDQLMDALVVMLAISFFVQGWIYITKDIEIHKSELKN